MRSFLPESFYHFTTYPHAGQLIWTGSDPFPAALAAFVILYLKLRKSACRPRFRGVFAWFPTQKPEGRQRPVPSLPSVGSVQNDRKAVTNKRRQYICPNNRSRVKITAAVYGIGYHQKLTACCERQSCPASHILEPGLARES